MTFISNDSTLHFWHTDPKTGKLARYIANYGEDITINGIHHTFGAMRPSAARFNLSICEDGDADNECWINPEIIADHMTPVDYIQPLAILYKEKVVGHREVFVVTDRTHYRIELYPLPESLLMGTIEPYSAENGQAWSISSSTDYGAFTARQLETPHDIKQRFGVSHFESHSLVIEAALTMYAAAHRCAVRDIARISVKPQWRHVYDKMVLRELYG